MFYKVFLYSHEIVFITKFQDIKLSFSIFSVSPKARKEHYNSQATRWCVCRVDDAGEIFRGEDKPCTIIGPLWSVLDLSRLHISRLFKSQNFVMFDKSEPVSTVSLVCEWRETHCRAYVRRPHEWINVEHNRIWRRKNCSIKILLGFPNIHQ